MEKIALIVNNNITGNLLLNNLVPSMFALNVQPVLYILSPKIPVQARIEGLKDIPFYDSTIGYNIIYPYLERQKYLLDNKGEPISSLSYSTKQLIELYELESYNISNINSPQALQALQNDRNIIGGISIRNLQIFKENAIATFNEKGFLWNLHSGLLPEYRGVDPQLWAMSQGQTQCGSTLHHVDTSIDTGDIIEIAHCPLNSKYSYLKGFFGKTLNSTEIIIRSIRQYLEHGRVPSIKQDQTQSQYYSFPTDENITNWERQGIHIAHPIEMLGIYLKNYSLPDTYHENQLKLELIQAIAEWEQAKEAPPTKKDHTKTA